MTQKSKENVWTTILRIVITVLTAIATSLTTQACMGGCAL